LREPVDSHIETLRACEREGRIGTVLVRSWPRELPLSGPVSDQEALEAFERFGDWADRTDVSIRPPFDVRTRSSTITGERRELVVTPTLCLALYAGDTLVSVYPHDDGTERHGVGDTVAALRTGRLELRTSHLPAEQPTDSCPACGDRVVNGQGVYVCIADDCHWTGLRTETGWNRTDTAVDPRAIVGRTQ
jgi:hypothetical protein